MRIESRDTSAPLPFDLTIVALILLVFRVLIPMIADVMRLVHAPTAVVFEARVIAPVVPKLDALLHGMPVEVIIIFPGQRAASACVEDTAEQLVCSAALVRVHMLHPLSGVPRLQIEELVRNIVGAPKQIHYLCRSLIVDNPVIRHQCNLPCRPELPPISKKTMHSVRRACGPASLCLHHCI